MNQSPFTLCTYYGLIDSLRALLRNPRRRRSLDVEEEIHFDPDDESRFVRPVHCCIVGVPHSSSSHENALRALEILVKEGGADVNGRDSRGCTAMHGLAFAAHHPQLEAAFRLLVSSGADVHARNDRMTTPLFYAVESGNLQILRLLAASGASPDGLVDVDGQTPLMWAAGGTANVGPERRPVLEEVLRLSSPETRRAVTKQGDSAIDWLVWAQRLDGQGTAFKPFEPWQLEVVAELRRSGTPVQPRFAAALLPSAAAHANRLDAELAARRSPSRRWRAHDCLVQLAFDHLEMREAEEGVRRREARLVELERRALEGLDEEHARAEALEEENAALKAQLRERDAVIERVRRAVGQGEGDDEEEESEKTTSMVEEESERKSESGGE
jgi:hypothetical protein